MSKRSNKNWKQQLSQKIFLSEEVYKNYKSTICQHPPETFALLGGYLNKPFEITDFRFCPPAKDKFGKYDSSSVHVNVDAEYMNWVIDNEFSPVGKYILGIWHSHPANCTSPSYGDPTRNEGDVVFFSSCLKADDSPDQNWNNFIAPITTFTSDGRDQIHGWYLPKGSDRPVKSEIVIGLPEKRKSTVLVKQIQKTTIPIQALPDPVKFGVRSTYLNDFSKKTHTAKVFEGIRNLSDSEFGTLMNHQDDLMDLLVRSSRF